MTDIYVRLKTGYRPEDVPVLLEQIGISIAKKEHPAEYYKNALDTLLGTVLEEPNTYIDAMWEEDYRNE